MLAALGLVLGPARAQQSSPRSVLIFPVHSHWLSAPLAQKIDAALVRSLTDAGFTATSFSRASALSRAVEEGWVTISELDRDGPEAARHVIALANGAAASLTGELTQGESRISLKLRLAGAVSQREASLEVTGQVLEGQEATAAELARGAAAALTPEVWSEAGADEVGQRAGAAERYVAGQQAMAEGHYRTATREFEAALIGDPDSPDYLAAAAEAQLGRGNSERALVRLRRLATLKPEDTEVRLRMGEVALVAGKADQAEAAFLAAASSLPSDPRVVEGLARAARAQKDVPRAQQHYSRLAATLPELADEPPWLPGLLASQRDDSIRLTGIPPDEVNRQLGRVYLAAGEFAEGVRALLAYHDGAERAPYEGENYLAIAEGLDQEGARIARRVQSIFAARALGQTSEDQAEAELDALHDRSERLATLCERMTVSPQLESSHRHRVLAWNLLNESNFEALMSLRTGDSDRRRRADLLRDASRKARADAVEFSRGLAEKHQP